ncbi:MAG: leucine--tRNA ligase [Patescibacteria group bacterium]|jgi:leucyl-tRNA synthetase
MSYDHSSVDPKWQKRWVESGIFQAKDSGKDKYYVLVEFPYPSGEGLHVGHPRSYTALDVVARKKRMEGKNVLFPMGWDAFGLPTENYAIKMGVHPSVVTKQNVDNFRRQLQSIGFSFDWSREINTTDPKYYRWTQWQFLQFFKAGLAYKAKALINWCPKDKIGLANEEVVGGCCERCGTAVERREKEQWMIAITKYADRLIDDLKDVDYLPKIKKQQEDWIGRSEGAEIEFRAVGVDPSIDPITVFTTRPDTIFGATYLVLAPEHPLVATLTTGGQKKAVEKYVLSVQKKTEIERGDDSKEKIGVFTGAYATNPATGEQIPVWIADYVLPHYGTGAIMAVPAHDERDFAFAKKFELKFKEVVLPAVIGNGVREWMTTYKASDEAGILEVIKKSVEMGESVYSHRGRLINSGQFDGMTSDEATKEIIQWLEEKGLGKKKTTFKLRDWVFSRQRYWGEPIPLVFCERCAQNGRSVSQDGRSPSFQEGATGESQGGHGESQAGWIAVPDSQLPVELPQVERYEPTDTGESPLASIESFVNTTCPQCGGPARRETDTMPNWAGSSWYFLRYADPHNDEAFASKEALKYWMPVDLYNGGMEHTTLHLLYSRFWNKFLFDQGLVPTSEPYVRRHSHGLIMSEDGTKMSKSKGNVVNPDEIVKEFGADTLRVYELFMGPFEEPVPWSTNGVIGVRRFLDKIERLSEKALAVGVELRFDPVSASEVARALHKTISKVTADIEHFKFNTAVSSMMSFVNEAQEKGISKESFALFLRILVPFAPHLANELWEKMGERGFVEEQAWPEADEKLLVDENVSIAVQVNGKLRATLLVPSALSDLSVLELARADINVQKFLTCEPKKVIQVKGKIVNFVV